MYFKKKIHDTMKNQRKRVQTDIQNMLHKIDFFLDDRIRKLPEELQDRWKIYFAKIYWSLKVHLLFYCGYPQNELDATNRGLKKLGEYCVPETERNSLPDLDRVIDPASTLLEMVSRKTIRNGPNSIRYSSV